MRVSASVFSLVLATSLAIASLAQTSATAKSDHKTSFSDSGKARCGLNAELRSVSFVPMYNPNRIDLEYLVTNVSGEDYELPKLVRFMSKSSDGVLHADANAELAEPHFISELSLPEQRYFPAGHTTAFVVSVNRYLLDHRPSTVEDKKQLGKQLSATKSYVIFDEKHACEIELPVSQRIMALLPSS